jgi:predicted DNA-binding transcriptional regulator AlpA
MQETIPQPESTDHALLAGWISRGELATALGLTADTLGRWEARRTGPPCVRAGRKVFYRRRAVQDWLAAQEMQRARTSGGRK